MTKKYTIYFGGYTEPYYLREPKEVKGLLEDYNKDPDKLTDDLQDLNDQLDQKDARDAEKITQKTADKLQADLNKFPILNQSVNQLLNKESVADLKELDDKIKEIKQNLQTTATERDEARKKRDQYKADRDKLRKKVNTIKPSWDFIVDKINKCKTVIIGDLQKKKIRHHMGQIAGEFA
ncbi:1906_t:CDS:2 [Ambispora leptoticha]|uniref:1906_t:CDS:1 n=1 Tax=Ambispora leptoticha TaxID=144679 RepID=A0A9N9BJF1_9GLOM|nr:1906_t:CDS:2 [Ambispora leptoticha]